MNTALFAVAVAFLAIGVASIPTGNGVVWSTFLTLGVVFLALAFALDRRDDVAPAGDSSDANGSSASVDEDV